VAYYYQDELGSTSHIADASGALLEYYKYDLYGRPQYFDSTSQPLNASTYGVKDLFTGQRWVTEIGLYDDRNRFMSPDLGRFLQPDPIGFKGDASNLYRYVGNNWANKTDPLGTCADACVIETAIAVTAIVTAYEMYVQGPKMAEASRNTFDSLMHRDTTGDHGRPNPQVERPDTKHEIPAKVNDQNKLDQKRTPITGKPNSTQEFPDGKGGKTVREYGPNGKGVKDTDYGHDHGAGDPHEHHWDGTKRGPGVPIGTNPTDPAAQPRPEKAQPNPTPPPAPPSGNSGKTG
jgi:RHS repeat-associated protein